MLEPMKTYRPSDTYYLLYDEIIADLFSQIFTKNKKFCLSSTTVPYKIGEKFEQYRNKTSEHMHGSRLDRHKLASCICGAIIEVKPLIGYGNANIPRNTNEILALSAGANVIKYYMIYDFLNLQSLPDEKKRNAKKYLKEKFDIYFPTLSENICDTHNYRQNFVDALYLSHHVCSITKKECFQYDIWAYSKIFYHLELYNKKYLEDIYKEYEESQ